MYTQFVFYTFHRTLTTISNSNTNEEALICKTTHYAVRINVYLHCIKVYIHIQKSPTRLLIR
jgi:hypothetical protein